MYRHPLHVAIVIFLAATAGCHRGGKGAPVGGSDVPPSKVNLKRIVDLTVAKQTNLVYNVETVGVIEAEGQTELAAGVAGIVDEVHFQEGQLVDPAQTQPLVRISKPLYEAALKVAEFEVQRAESRAAEAKKNWDLIQGRLQSVSESERLQREFAVKLAEAELSASRAGLEKARYNLSLSQMKPPYKGRINKRLVTKGSRVDEKTVIATMADLSRIRLTAFIPETATPAVRDLLDRRDRAFPAIRDLLARLGMLNSPADLHSSDLPADFDPEFSVLAFPGKSFRARIFYLSTVGDPATHQFECKAEIDIRDEGPTLLPGFTARVRVPLQTRSDAVLVPEESLRSTERGWLVFVPDLRIGGDGRPEWLARAVRVEPGYRNKGMVEIRSGLAGGEVIVQKGADALAEEGGTPLRIPEEQMSLLKNNPKP